MAVADHEVLTWEQFGLAGRELAELVRSDGFEPTMIVSIARGGLFAGGALSYALNVKNVYVMNVEFYTGEDERLPMPVMLPPVPNVVVNSVLSLFSGKPRSRSAATNMSPLRPPIKSPYAIFIFG